MELLRALEGIRTPFLDSVIGAVTQLGEETIGIIILCIIFWCISKRAAYIIGAVFFISGLIVQGGKISFQIERPWILDPTLNPVPAAIGQATGYSFPSGHTQTAASIFGALGAQIKIKAIAGVCFALPVLVAFSRLYLGVHTLQDVLVSLLISAVVIFIMVRLLHDDKSWLHKSFWISIVILALAAIVAALSLILYHSGQIDVRYVHDCMKVAGAAVGFGIGFYVERVFINFTPKSKNVAVHAVKCILGVAGIVAFQEVLVWNFDPGLLTDFFVYFAIIIWITVIYPIFIKKFFALREEAAKEN